MYYFELFELPVSLKADKASVLKKYYLLSRQFHPDRFSLQPAEAQDKALQISTEINQAKNMLDDPYLRLAYILKEKQLISENEKYTLPALFLGEMMDINEKIMDLELEESASEKEQLKAEIDAVKADLYGEVKMYFEMDELEADQDDFAKLKDYYYKLKYVNRILEKLS
jgi:molecular chaperone HscB